MSRWNEFVDTLYAQNQFAIKYDLESMRVALELSVRLPIARQVILIGGTNGKGTTACYLHAACVRAGLRTGLYTSPHLVDFRERMRVNGAPIDVETCTELGWQLLDRFSGRTRPAETPRPLSYFELTTLLCFQWFAAQHLDVAVIEVGMGGRLDATNTLEPDVSVLTSVSLDHQQFLGPTVEAIASEKAWIARKGKPCLVHASSGGFDALRAALEHHAPALEVVEGGIDATGYNQALARAAFRHVTRSHGVDAVREHQAWAAALRDARWPARRQLLHARGTTWWLDGAHNEASLRDIAPWFQQQVANLGKPVPALVASSPGRDVAEVFAPLRGCFCRVVVVPASPERTADPVEVAHALARAGFSHVTAYATLAEGMDALHGEAFVAVTGSLYLCGGVLAALGETAETLSVVAAAG